MLVVAARDIEAGEELTFDYMLGMHEAASQAERRQHLHQQYRFWCTCTVCTALTVCAEG